MIPQRVQLSRKRGWKLPANTVVVSRGRGRKFGNPHKVTPRLIEQCGSVEAAAVAMVSAYRDWMKDTPQGRELSAQAKVKLRGKHLACWCPPGQACHADVLLEIANSK